MYGKVSYYEEWYVGFAETVKQMRHELHRIDKLGAFQADDEVGYFFEALKEMCTELFKMGFFDEPPEDLEPTRRSAINVTTDQKQAAMEHEQKQQYHNSMGPPGDVQAPPVQEQPNG
jgi:hypothetical protein